MSLTDDDLARIATLSHKELKILLKFIREQFKGSQTRSFDSDNVVSVRLSEETRRSIDALARSRRITRSRVIRDAVHAWTKRQRVFSPKSLRHLRVAA